MIEKICKICYKSLPLSCFSKHPSCKYGVASTCKSCHSAWQKEYYKSNPHKLEEKRKVDKEYQARNIERHRENSRKYRQENIEYVSLKNSEYRKNNQDKLKEYFKDYYIKNKQKKIEYAISYAQKNKERKSEYLKDYQQKNKDTLRVKTRELKKANKEQYKIYGLNYIARKNNAVGYYTTEQWITLCNFFNGICPACNKKIDSFQVDHIIPLTWDNTSNWITNIQPLCKSCNTGKSNHHATDYRPEHVKIWAMEQMELCQ